MCSVNQRKNLKNYYRRRKIEEELKENWRKIQEGMFIQIDLMIRQIDPNNHNEYSNNYLCLYRRTCQPRSL